MMDIPYGSSEYLQIISYYNGDSTNSEKYADKSELSIRATAMSTEACRIASQTALSWQYSQQVERLKMHSYALDRAVNFSTFIRQGILLPAISSQENLQKIEGNNLINTSVRYKLVEGARFVMTAPTWRSYLLKSFPPPDTPNKGIWPRNPQEKALWISQVNKCWIVGTTQAQEVLRNSIARMIADIDQRVTFLVLEKRGVVSMPIVARSTHGTIRSSDGKTISIGDEVYSVTRHSNFNSSDWRAIWSYEDSEN
ncbi:hypothetical protein C4K68_09665 [Pokkaliibacter plantistimulans]|uniref:Type IV secretion system protein DotC n=1 Tax=Proteobacteria bacterium 228 TaxID=2083153 RepID=A0A2S5KTL9_9PROT|nr:type IV secretory system conjugative DNA transfer family protein [Pokkaliibacter plantistimulans]PPC77616.1 hypothetical protein C4K68_09665 [Pokkaliibacter plantistimulans]